MGTTAGTTPKTRIVAVPISQTAGGGAEIQRVSAAQVGKKIGYAVLNLAAETVLGPLADFKNLIRVGWHNYRGETDKADKVKKRVTEEWIGDYDDDWMAAVHAISTTCEKLAGLAGVIGFLATIASIWVAAAAPVAAVSAVVALVFTSIAFILRSILTIANAVKWYNGDSKGKKAFWTNLVGAFGNLLGIITFGVAAALNQGVKFNAETIAQSDFKRDLGIGLGFSATGKTAGVANDLVQAKPDPIQRNGKKQAQSPLVADIAQAFTELEELLPQEKKSIKKDKASIGTSKSSIGTVGGKLSQAMGEGSQVSGKVSEIQSGANTADSESVAPTEEDGATVSEKEVKSLEKQLDKGEAIAEQESAPAAKSKPSLWQRIKARARQLGQSIKRAGGRFFGRLSSAFSRFKALMAKLKAKIVAMVLKASGLDVKLGMAQKALQKDAANLEEQEVATDERTTLAENAEEKLAEFK